MWPLFSLVWFLFLFLLVCVDGFLLVRFLLVPLVSFRWARGLVVVEVHIVVDALRVCSGRRYFCCTFLFCCRCVVGFAFNVARLVVSAVFWWCFPAVSVVRGGC